MSLLVSTPHPDATRSLTAVAELQGLYGPFTFPEKLLQKIWLRGDFNRSRAALNDGRALVIKHPGRWNLLGGPDFKDARLRFGDGEEIVGDVELHLRAADWAAHGHASDSAYDRVILHVVLFPLASNQKTVGAGGREIPAIALLPLLHYDLEEYATEDAVELLANRPAAHIIEELGPLPPAELERLVLRHARARWQQKVRFAELRIKRLGWTEACHQTALEVLGYRFNRATMLRVAGAHPLAEWSNSTIDPDAIFESERGGWSLQGIRPANHPRNRLRQYASWVRVSPDWPVKLRGWGERLPRLSEGGITGTVRADHHFTEVRRAIAADVCGAQVGGTRFDNLLCDGFLSLLTADLGRDFGNVWYHWFTGDLPPLLPRALRQLQIFEGRARPACHGAAQGLLGWLIERERAALGSRGRGA